MCVIRNFVKLLIFWGFHVITKPFSNFMKFLQNLVLSRNY